MKKIELLFPELCNIYGESYNVEYLKRSNPENIEVINTNHRDTPAFVTEDVDMIYLGCTTERKQEQIIEILKPHKERILQLIDKGVIFLVTGNSPEIFGNYIKDGERTIEALGIFDFYSVRYMDRERHNSQYIGKYGDLTMLGHRSQFSYAYGEFENNFVEIERGIGMNPDTKREGIHVNNFFATYSLGPYLILNPYFAKELLAKMGLETTLCYEKEIIEAYEYRLKELLRTLNY